MIGVGYLQENTLVIYFPKWNHWNHDHERNIIWGLFLNHHHPEGWPWQAEICGGFNSHTSTCHKSQISLGRLYNKKQIYMLTMWPIGSLHQLSRGKPSIPTTGRSPPVFFGKLKFPEIWVPKTSFCIKSLCFLGMTDWRWWWTDTRYVGSADRLLVKGTTNTQDWAWQAVKSI